MNLLKSEIRELVRPLRRLITPEYRLKASLATAQHFAKSSFFHDNNHFACYMAVAEELDTQPLMQTVWQAGKSCYLPLISPSPEKQLRFALYEQGMKLTLNQHRVLEPVHSPRILSGSELDVVLFPLLAFDSQGNRLGTGGGYYDRTFEFVLQPGFAKGQKPLLLGLGFELQKVERIPREAFDVPLEGVVTEEGMLRF